MKLRHCFDYFYFLQMFDKLFFINDIYGFIYFFILLYLIAV